jgi:apolipoprotein D and lipocalin family protein
MPYIRSSEVDVDNPRGYILRKDLETNMIRIALILLPLLLAGCAVRDLVRRPPVGAVDIHRYVGVWYEIARYDHSFERGLVGVTATYELRPGGTVGVLNQGRDGSLTGRLKQARAVAKPTGNPGIFRVYFVPLFGAEYRILYLDSEYRYVLVGSSSMKYLWVLSRTPRVTPEDYRLLLDKASAMGYDTTSLILVPQD